VAANPVENGTPGVLAPPPVIYATFLLVGLGLQSVWPVAVLPETLRYVAGGGVVAASFVLAGLGLRAFVRARTSVNVYRSSSALIVEGPFRFSRNPLYVSLTMLYCGIALALGNVWMLALGVPVVVVMHYGVILREERYLQRRFGAEYERYNASVRRWL
jgi:protein-S-isoprenylcysteine O-methyltransferase Ste14